MNPYDRRVWDYAVSVAAAAARAGFDEIMLDYVRFPTDGDVGTAVYPGRTSEQKGEVIAAFVAYAKQRLAPLGVRVSTALFGLSATRDMGLGQVPAWISQHVDHVNPMAYPCLYGGGELGIVTPSAEPGETVFRTLVDFKRQLKGSNAQLIPWIQDWNYDREQVLQQVRADAPAGGEGLPALERRTASTPRPRCHRPRSRGAVRARVARAPSRRPPARSARGRAAGSGGSARARPPAAPGGSPPQNGGSGTSSTPANRSSAAA